MATPIRTGDRVLLRANDGTAHVLEVQEGTKRVPGLGVLNLSDLAGKAWGTTWTVGSERFQVLRPRLSDHLQLLERGAQIITPKDAARILLECGLHAGARVLEAGVGSGALTLVIANAVRPGGRVIAVDLRADHLSHARKNLERAGLADAVEFREADARKPVPETGLDAFVADVPDPEHVVPVAWNALASSGTFAAYTTNVTQLEAVARALRAQGFQGVRNLELIERGWVVGDRGSRPETNMLGHTGFLTFARRP